MSATRVTVFVNLPKAVGQREPGGAAVSVNLSASFDGKIAWYENRVPGDANDDGVVAFADFLTLSTNFGNMHAVWHDGD